MFGFFRKRKAASPAPAVPVDDTRMMTFVDVYGRSLQMPLGQWRRDILAPNLRQQWNHPDGLYGLVIAALDENVAIDVDEASVQLAAIDPMVERGAVTRAIVQMKLGRLRDAKATIHRAIDVVGPTASLLVNEAKILHEEGHPGRAIDMLERALRIDPNLANGLGWRVALAQEAGGDDAAQACLVTLSGLQGAWRPQLLLGQRAIKAGQREKGLALLDEALARAPHGTDVMLVVSGELGKQGLIADAVERIAPIYDERRDDIRAGYNLLQAYLELQDGEAGKALLDRLFALGMPAYADHLQWYANAFDELTRLPPQPVSKLPEITLVQMALPPWLLGMQDMSWAAPPRGAGAPRVVLLPLAAVVDPSITTASTGREDARGRLSRALPLLMLEQLVFCSELDAAMNLPVADGHHLVLFGSPTSEDELEYLGRDFAYAVEGEVAPEGDGFTVVCRLRRLDDMATLLRVAHHVTDDTAGDVLIAVTGELLAALGEATGMTIEPRVPHYVLPEAYTAQYLGGLGQTLALTLASTPETRADLHGERNIYGWMQTLAVTLPHDEPAQFMYFTALAKGRRSGSTMVDEFEKPAVQRMRELVKENRYSARLLPLVAAVFPSNDELYELLATAKAAHEPGYAAWCARIAGTFPVAGAR